jgi:glycosyltransferase involved in cell wall biosynthesis
VKVLLVSSFVLPLAGGVEQFVDTTKRAMRLRGLDVRVLACRLPGSQTDADATLPTNYLPPAGWPLPVGGWRTLWREVEAAEVVVVNGGRQLLPIVAAVAARLRSRPVVYVLHGTGQPLASASAVYHGVFGSLFDRTLVRLALRLSIPVAVAQVGVRGVRARHGVSATYIPFPLRDLPSATANVSLRPDDPVRVAWVGRLYPEKDPLLAVEVVERLRRRRNATLELYGDGRLRGELEELARHRPWLAIRGARTWLEIQEIQERAHVCLSTSLGDAVNVSILEPLCRGVPVVATRVGDAESYYIDPSLGRFCVPPGDAAALRDALVELTSDYERYRRAFAANAAPLKERHERGVDSLIGVIVAASRGKSAGRRAWGPSPPTAS